MVQVRPLAPAEINLVKSMISELGHADVSIDSLGAAINAPGLLILIAWREGTPIGWARAHELPGVEPGHCDLFVYEIDVVPGERRRGTGRALMEAMLSFSKQRGHHEVFTIARSDNAPACRLYESAGFDREEVPEYVYIHRHAASS
jgi:ribosomal protein S18 acetylase RimI-like enzyme